MFRTIVEIPLPFTLHILKHQVRSIPIYGYGVMFCLAFLFASSLAARLARRVKLDPEIVLDLAFYILIGGVVGARGFYAWEYWGTKIKSFSDVLWVWEGGIVLYGGVLGATAAGFLFWLKKRFPLLPTLDVAAPAIALGVALGRLGCFFNGCCYGDRCSLPWAVRFPKDSPPWIDQVKHRLIPESAALALPIHPTQLYSVIDGLVLMALLLTYFPIRRRDGEVMALLMVTYPISRFLIEFLRSDEPAFFAGLTVSQNISAAILLAGLAFWTYLFRQPATRHADLTVA